MQWILIVQYGCNANRKNICHAFDSLADATRHFSCFAQLAEKGQWYERLSLEFSPYPIRITDRQRGEFVLA